MQNDGQSDNNELTTPLPGSITVSCGQGEYQVYGGPYRTKPYDFYGVKMAEEINEPCAVDIPTKDFDVPGVAVMREGLSRGVMAILSGQKVYAGCMGGIGRTGLFLALVSKVFSEADALVNLDAYYTGPITHVRTSYKKSAVETVPQIRFIQDFDVRDLARLVANYHMITGQAFTRRVKPASWWGRFFSLFGI